MSSNLNPNRLTVPPTPHSLKRARRIGIANLQVEDLSSSSRTFDRIRQAVAPLAVDRVVDVGSIFSNAPSSTTTPSNPYAMLTYDDYDLAKAYPSIATSINVLRALRGTTDATEIQAALIVIGTTFQNVITAVLDRHPKTVRLSRDYEGSRYICGFVAALFERDLVARLDEVSPENLEAFIDIALDLACLAADKLQVSLTVAGQLSGLGQPRPPRLTASSRPIPVKVADQKNSATTSDTPLARGSTQTRNTAKPSRTTPAVEANTTPSKLGGPDKYVSVSAKLSTALPSKQCSSIAVKSSPPPLPPKPASLVNVKSCTTALPSKPSSSVAVKSSMAVTPSKSSPSLAAKSLLAVASSKPSPSTAVKSTTTASPFKTSSSVAGKSPVVLPDRVPHPVVARPATVALASQQPLPIVVTSPTAIQPSRYSTTSSIFSAYTLVEAPPPDAIISSQKPGIVHRAISAARNTTQEQASKSTSQLSSKSNPTIAERLHSGLLCKNASKSTSTLSSKNSTGSSTTAVSTRKKPVEEEVVFILSSTGPLPFFPDDGDAPECDVESPLPTGVSASVIIDPNGLMGAASIPALIRMLTSRKMAVSEDAIIFMTCFRSFLTPLQLFENLKARFEEPMPAIVSRSQVHVWIHEAMYVRTRVVRILIIWLEQYWKPASDDYALDLIRVFEPRNSHVPLLESLSDHLSRAIDEVLEGGVKLRRVRRDREVNLINAMSLVPEPLPTKFKYEVKKSKESKDNNGLYLAFFDSCAGREEFARQLALCASELYHDIDPEQAIAYWQRDGKPPEGGVAVMRMITFEKAFCLWVTQTILDKPTPEERIKVIEFWLDVATKCIQYNNFSSAYCIYSGLVTPPIDRLKRTIVQISIPSKEQYRPLKSTFSGVNNFTEYRKALAEAEGPIVPLLQTFAHDAVALNVVPNKVKSLVALEENLVNFRAYRIVMKTIRAMERCFIPYKFEKQTQFGDWFEAQISVYRGKSEEIVQNEFYIKSEGYEPRLKNAPQSVWLQTLHGSLNGDFRFEPLRVGIDEHDQTPTGLMGLLCFKNFLK